MIKVTGYKADTTFYINPDNIILIQKCARYTSIFMLNGIEYIVNESVEELLTPEGAWRQR